MRIDWDSHGFIANSPLHSFVVLSHGILPLSLDVCIGPCENGLDPDGGTEADRPSLSTMIY